MPNYRVSGGYTFPWQVQVSGVFQSVGPAAQVGNAVATLPVNNATAGITLGRPIATAGGVINAPLLDPAMNKDFADRVNQVDLRVTKGFRVGRYRLDALVDFYNLFNVVSGSGLHHDVFGGDLAGAYDYPAVRVCKARRTAHVLGIEKGYLSRRVFTGGNIMMRLHVPIGWIIAAALFPAAGLCPDLEGFVREGHCADPVRQVRHVPSAWRGRADVAQDVRRSAAVGSRDQEQGRLAPDAPVVCRGGPSRMAERSPSESGRDRQARGMGGCGRAARQ